MSHLLPILQKADALLSSFIHELDEPYLVYFIWLCLLLGPPALWSSARSIMKQDRRYVVGTLLMLAAAVNSLVSVWFLYAHGVEFVRTSIAAAGILFVAVIVCVILFPLCLLGSQIRAAVELRRLRHILISIFGVGAIAAGFTALAQHVPIKIVLMAAGIAFGSLFVGFLNHFFIPEEFESDSL